jgi:hypothetical protein
MVSCASILPSASGWEMESAKSSSALAKPLGSGSAQVFAPRVSDVYARESAWELVRRFF